MAPERSVKGGTSKVYVLEDTAVYKVVSCDQQKKKKMKRVARLHVMQVVKNE